MNYLKTSGVLAVLILFVSGCASRAVVEKPYTELQDQIQEMWFTPGKEKAIIILPINGDKIPSVARKFPDAHDVSNRPGWLYDSVSVEEQKGKTTYTVLHRFETSGAAMPWARTFISIRELSNEKTDIRITAEEIGLLFNKRNRSREQWLIERLN